MMLSMFGLQLWAAVVDAAEAITAWQNDNYPPNPNTLAGSWPTKWNRAGRDRKQMLTLAVQTMWIYVKRTHLGNSWRANILTSQSPSTWMLCKTQWRRMLLQTLHVTHCHGSRDDASDHHGKRVLKKTWILTTIIKTEMTLVTVTMTVAMVMTRPTKLITKCAVYVSLRRRGDGSDDNNDVRTKWQYS